MKNTVDATGVTVTVTGDAQVADAVVTDTTVYVLGVADAVVTDTTVYVLGAGYVVGLTTVSVVDGLYDAGTTGTEVEYFTGAVEVLTVV